MFYIGLYCENMKKNHLISISCWILLKVLPLSKLFDGLYDAFPLTACFL